MRITIGLAKWWQRIVSLCFFITISFGSRPDGLLFSFLLLACTVVFLFSSGPGLDEFQISPLRQAVKR
jgi:hypothetical protein